MKDVKGILPSLIFQKKKIKNNLIRPRWPSQGRREREALSPLVSLLCSFSSFPPSYAILLGVFFNNGPDDLEPLPPFIFPSLVSLSERLSLPPSISLLVSLFLYFP